MKRKEFLQTFLSKTFGVAMVVMMFGFVGVVVVRINKVLSGHGLDYYISGMGYELNYLVPVHKRGYFFKVKAHRLLKAQHILICEHF